MFNIHFRSFVLALAFTFSCSALAATVDVPTKVEAPLPGDTPAAAEPTKPPKAAAQSKSARKHGKVGKASARGTQQQLKSDRKTVKNNVKTVAKSGKSKPAAGQHSKPPAKKR